MSRTPRQKNIRSVYFPRPMLEELEAEARRLDRPIQWIVRRAWSLAVEELRKLPSARLGAGR